MYYATVGIKQIQSYLGRSRHLWGRRGASDILVYLTDVSGLTDEIPAQNREFRTVKEELPRGVEVNDEAVDVDGVVRLRSTSREDLARATESLALRIATHLPAAKVETALREAGTYLDVLRAEDARQEPLESRSYPPAIIEFPLAHHCDECSAGVAHEEKNVADVVLRLCADCAARVEGPRNETLRKAVRELDVGRRIPGFLAEQEMLNRIGSGAKQVENLIELAALGDAGDKGRRRHTGNHVATIFADGNGLGALFSHARTDAINSGTTKHVKLLSAAVKRVTKEALARAIESISGPNGQHAMPAVPHILGGDDILVSVPATRAWEFLIEFLEAAKAGLSSDDQLSGSGVSFSAGMVICKAAYPIGDQISLAEHLLRQAKTEVNGADWSFAWQDVTHEGPKVGEPRVLTLDQWESLNPLMRQARQLGSGTKQGNAARTTLRAELEIRDPKARALRLQHLAHRLSGADALLDAALGSGWDKRDRIDDSEVQDLLNVLQIMRWKA